jgi:bacteriocin biosynthesis cyclodehydratase domain-containing protein
VSDHEHRDDRPSGPERVRLLQGHVGHEDLTPPLADPAGGRRYHLRCSVDAFLAGDGSLYFVRAGGEDLRVRDASDDDVRLVRSLLEGAATAGQLATRSALPVATVEEKLAALVEAGVTAAWPGGAALDATDAERFSRQLPFLAEFGDPAQMQAALRAAHVLVIGTGGLGSWVLASLCASGVGRYTLVDPDVVECSNLNRQILFGPGSLGRPKVHEAADWVMRYDPRAEVRAVQEAVRGRDDIERWLPGTDLVVLAADWPPYEISRWVNASCLAACVPFVSAGQQLPIVKVGPAYVPGRTACFTCHERELREASPLYDEYVAHVRSARRPVPTLGTASGVAGALVAHEVVTLLLIGQSSIAGAAAILDLATMRMELQAVEQDPACPVCKHASPWEPIRPRQMRPA